MSRGYFGIGIERARSEENLGVLWRTAHCMGASFIFTIGARYEYDCSDTSKAWRSVPLFQYASFAEFHDALPKECSLIGVEYPHEGATILQGFRHPDRAAYLLGGERLGMSPEALAACSDVVYIPSAICLNVSVAGSIVLYDRIARAA